MERPNRIAISAIAGLVSAALALAIEHSPIGNSAIPDFLGVGGSFGVALAICFALYEPDATRFRLACLVFISVLAYPAAYYSAVWSIPFVGNDPLTPKNLIPAFFLAGCVGALVLGVARIFVFAPRKKPLNRWLGTILIYCLAGGVLGAVGAFADGTRSQGFYDDFRYLHFLWQPVMAVLLVRPVRAEVTRGEFEVPVRG